MPEESAGANVNLGFQDHFSETAHSYVRHRPAYPNDLVRYLAQLSPQRQLAWEAGCGSGQLSARLSECFALVVATDASLDQLALAPAVPRLAYRCERAEASSLPSGCVDLSVAAQAAHWFDLKAYYAEVRRVSRPDAAVALVTYGAIRIDGAPGQVVRRFARDTLQPYWPPERRFVNDGYGTLSFPFPEIEAENFDIRATWSAADVLGYVGTWSAVRALRKADGRRLLKRFWKDLLTAWGNGIRRRAVRWPLTVRVGCVARGFQL